MLRDQRRRHRRLPGWDRLPVADDARRVLVGLPADRRRILGHVLRDDAGDGRGDAVDRCRRELGHSGPARTVVGVHVGGGDLIPVGDLQQSVLDDRAGVQRQRSAEDAGRAAHLRQRQRLAAGFAVAVYRDRQTARPGQIDVRDGRSQNRRAGVGGEIQPDRAVGVGRLGDRLVGVDAAVAGLLVEAGILDVLRRVDDQLAHVGGGQPGVSRADQRGQARHRRGGERGPAVAAVLVPVLRGVDARTRCRDLDLRTGIGETAPRVVVRGRRNRDHLGSHGGKGDRRAAVSAGAVDHHVLDVVGVSQRVADRLRLADGETQRDDVGPVVGRVEDRVVHDPGVGPRLADAQRHAAHARSAEPPGHTGDADPVAPLGVDDAHHHRAVGVGRARVVVVVVEVPAFPVVDEAVAVVVHAVVRNLALVVPDVAGQILVVDVRSRVQHRHDDRRIARRQVPGALGVDVGAGSAAGLSGVVESPLLPVLRVVGCRQVGAVRGHLRVANEARAVQQLAPGHRVRSVGDLQVDDRQAVGTQRRQLGESGEGLGRIGHGACDQLRPAAHAIREADGDRALDHLEQQPRVPLVQLAVQPHQNLRRGRIPRGDGHRPVAVIREAQNLGRRGRERAGGGDRPEQRQNEQTGAEAPASHGRHSSHLFPNKDAGRRRLFTLKGAPGSVRKIPVLARNSPEVSRRTPRRSRPIAAVTTFCARLAP